MKAVVTCVTLALALATPGGAPVAAEEAPAQSVRIIVPLSAGSAFDILARAMGNAFKQRTQQPVSWKTVPAATWASPPMPARVRRPTATRCAC